jgi:predicted transcriptional regulator
MSNVLLKTSDVAGFFDRARTAAQKADRGDFFEEKLTLSFEDPKRMFAVLSEQRRRLMSEVMREPKTISELSKRLHRNRSTITKDVGVLERAGLVRSHKQPNPAGHGVQKLVCALAAKIEVSATLEAA